MSVEALIAALMKWLHLRLKLFRRIPKYGLQCDIRIGAVFEKTHLKIVKLIYIDYLLQFVVR